ncbi:MAG: prepilin-type N-terminal cleavage/methylation domain-containing protein [Rickettsiales bacterium]|jgi:prepilin-type N-terminal cleavage/methylation domain-containing protein
MKKIKNKNGFSLIEISIVMLLIGILVAGISQGSILKKQMKINAAKSLTKGSPVNAIPDLVVWYETTLETSFNEVDIFDGKALTNVDGSAWKDNSPVRGNNAVIFTTEAPAYVKYGINDLPSLRFNGTDEHLITNYTRLVGKNYTIFAVEARGDGNKNPVIGSDVVSYGYSSSNTLNGSLINGTQAVPIFASKIPRILTFLSAPKILTTKGVFVNGGNGSAAPSAIADGSLFDSQPGFVGQGVGEFYNGDISEIIIFNRALDLLERNAIQDYLSNKYKINVTPST